MKPALSVYRGILREIRYMDLQSPIRTDLASYISKEFKKHEITEQKFCRANESAFFYAKTYLEMLRSTRQHEILTKLYKGKGERTTEQAANLVGLNMPKTYSP